MPREPRRLLKLLRINNIALIPALEIEFGAGLTLLTGETGAGKSILIDALGLLLGERASADLDPLGRGAGRRSRRSSSCREAAALLEERGLPADGDEISCAARSRRAARGARRVNGALVPVRLLRDLAPCARGRSTASTSRRACSTRRRTSTLLDHFAGTRTTAGRSPSSSGTCARAEAALERLRGDRREVERRREMLEYQAARDREGRARAGRGGGAARREGAPGERGAPGRAERRGLRAPLRRRGRGPLPPRPGLPAGRGPGGDRPVASRPSSRPAPRSSPRSRTSPCACATTARARGQPRAPRRDRVAPRRHRAPEEEVRRDGRRGPRLRRALPRASSTALGSPEEQERALEARRERAGRALPRAARGALSKTSAGRRRRAARARCRRSSRSSRWRRRASRCAFAPAGRTASSTPRRVDGARPRARRVPALAEPRRGAAAARADRLGRRAVAHPARA